MVSGKEGQSLLEKKIEDHKSEQHRLAIEHSRALDFLEATEDDSYDFNLLHSSHFSKADKEFHTNIMKEIEKDFSPYEIVTLWSRNINRPQTQDCIKLFDKFMKEEYEGDLSIMMGLAKLNKTNVAIVGQRRGHNPEEISKYRAGRTMPQGFLNSIDFIKKYGNNIPVIFFADTQGAEPTVKSEEENIASVISNHITTSLNILQPTISVILGEGESGGVLPFIIADKVFILRYSILSVISPEGCAGILEKDLKKALKKIPYVAKSLKITVNDLIKLKIFQEEDVIEEPLGGAHLDHELTLDNIRSKLISTLDYLYNIPQEKLLELRYNRYRNIAKSSTDLKINKRFKRHLGLKIIDEEKFKYIFYPNKKRLEERLKNIKICPSCNRELNETILKEKNYICYRCNTYLRLNANQTIEILTDENSFEEFNRYMISTDPLNFKNYKNQLKKAQERTGRGDAIATGKATINNNPCYLAVLDFDFLGGSFGSVVGEKICLAGERALEEKIPYIIISRSGGARMQEGVFSLMQMTKTNLILEKLKQSNILTISYICDPTFGGTTASFATATQKIYGEPKANMGFAGRRVIKLTNPQEKFPDNFQKAENYNNITILPRGKAKDIIGNDLAEYFKNGNPKTM